jgi:hypothetical protein
MNAPQNKDGIKAGFQAFIQSLQHAMEERVIVKFRQYDSIRSRLVS